MKQKTAIIELPEDLWHYIGIVSPERAMKLPASHFDAQEFRQRMEELFAILRNTTWQ